MTEFELTIDEFMSEVAEPELQRQVDEMIEAQTDAEDRALLERNRERIMRELMRITEIANLRHRLREAEDAMRAPAGEVLH